MITIHSTKKLLTKLPVDKNGMLANTKSKPALPSPTASPLSGWHANLIILQGHHCILFVHDSTRFPVFIKELLKPDFGELNWRFEDGFMNTLLKAGASDRQLQAAGKALQPLQFDTDCNRSVQGTMNQMAGDIEYRLRYDKASLENIAAYRTGAWLADRPCKVKGIKEYIRPDKAMLTLLDELSENKDGEQKKEAHNSAGNVVSIESYRIQKGNAT